MSVRTVGRRDGNRWCGHVLNAGEADGGPKAWVVDVEEWLQLQTEICLHSVPLLQLASTCSLLPNSRRESLVTLTITQYFLLKMLQEIIISLALSSPANEQAIQVRTYEVEAALWKLLERNRLANLLRELVRSVEVWSQTGVTYVVSHMRLFSELEIASFNLSLRQD